MKRKNLIILFLFASSLVAAAQQDNELFRLRDSPSTALDPFEKHFESYGYGWGSVYRYGGGVGLNMLSLTCSTPPATTS